MFCILYTYMDTTIFKAYDIRGIYPQSMNEDVAKAVAKACVYIFDEGEVIVARDIRHGSTELSVAVAETIKKYANEVGKKITVRDVGISSTPMFYFLVNKFKASGGCMITASHNPKNYNGMKVVTKGAEMIPGTELLAQITKLNIQ